MIPSPESSKADDHYNAKLLLPESDSMIELTVPDDCVGMRLDQALARLRPAWSRSRLQSWIREKRISVDNAEAVAKQKVWGGEKIEIRPGAHPAETGHAPEDIALNIVYEDDALIVINKPAGLVVHPGSGNWQGTMLNALLHHAAQLAAIPRAGIVHRLDKDTSGVLVVAKTLEAQTSLVRQLQQRSVKRDYLAFVLGEVKTGGVVDAPIGRHPLQRTRMAVIAKGKEARTHYRVVEQFDDVTLLRCSLETGRTHQIRVHMHALHHPLLGDPVYGSRPKQGAHMDGIEIGFPRQALHARRLELAHPRHGQVMAWEAPLPSDMDDLLALLRQQRAKLS